MCYCCFRHAQMLILLTDPIAQGALNFLVCVALSLQITLDYPERYGGWRVVVLVAFTRIICLYYHIFGSELISLFQL